MQTENIPGLFSDNIDLRIKFFFNGALWERWKKNIRKYIFWKW